MGGGGEGGGELPSLLQRTSARETSVIILVYILRCVSTALRTDSRRRSQRVDGMTEATAGSPKKENYVIIVDERKIKVLKICA